MAYDMAEELYIGTTGGVAEQDTLSSCGNRMVEDKSEMPIADSESGDWRSRARQPETPDIGGKTAINHEESAAMDKGEQPKDVSTRFLTLAPEIMAVGRKRPSKS